MLRAEPDARAVNACRVGVVVGAVPGITRAGAGADALKAGAPVEVANACTSLAKTSASQDRTGDLPIAWRSDD